MGAYNAARFSKQYSERTEKNLDYIRNTQKRKEDARNFRSTLLEEYNNSLLTVNTLIEQIRSEAKFISSGNNGRIKEIKNKLFSTANKIEECKKKLKFELDSLESENSNKDELYKITQLLNSMMGIVALPYEMHKEYFKDVSDDKKSDDNKKLSKYDLQKDAQSWEETAKLRKYICKLYCDGKWVTTYKSDINDGNINKNIVFGFLKHMRNAVCHSGDGAINILPLDDGEVIKEVMFYDTYDEQEFALLVTIDELYEIVELIADFYRNSPIGMIDKSNALVDMESKVKKLLESEYKKAKIPREWLY